MSELRLFRDEKQGAAHRKQQRAQDQGHSERSAEHVGWRAEVYRETSLTLEKTPSRSPYRTNHYSHRDQESAVSIEGEYDEGGKDANCRTDTENSGCVEGHRGADRKHPGEERCLSSKPQPLPDKWNNRPGQQDCRQGCQIGGHNSAVPAIDKETPDGGC